MNKIIRLSMLSIIACNVLYAEETISLEAVTVTVNKMEENIQDVPQSISVIDEEIIEEKGIKNIADVIKEIPNMTGGPSSGMEVNFRGLNTSLFTNNNPVVIYIDGVATSSRYGFDASLANVERIEVLRGPQGTLYGKDAIGAVIKIVTKEPSNETTGSIGVEYGSYQYMHGSFNISTPIVEDKLYFGINGDISKDDGWITNDYNGDDKASQSKDYSLSTFLRYKINDNFSAKLVVTKEETQRYFDNRLSQPGSPDLSLFKRDDAEHANYDMLTREKNAIDSQSLDLAYEGDGFTIHSVTTHRKSDFHGTYDSDFSSGNLDDGLSQFNNFEEETYTQELRISSKNTDGIRWVGGLYADREERTQAPYGFEFPNYNPSTFEYIGSYYMDSHSDSTTETQAIFGQVMIPFSTQFELTLGGRYQKITKDIDLDMYFLPLDTTGEPFYQLNDENSWNVFLPKAALAYKISEKYTSYVSVSKGYMPGGYNYFPTSGSVEDNSFEPQRSTNYELGLKGTLDNLIFGASLFRMDITDLHVYRTTGTGLYLTENAEKAHTQGIEFDFNYFPTDNLEVSGAVGFIDSKYDDYDTGAERFDGERIEKTPSHTANLGVAYHHPSGYYGRVDIKNQGDMYFYDDGKKKFVKEDGHTVEDIKLGYKTSELDIYVYVTNLSDEEYINTYISNSSLSIATFNDPRTFGVGVNYKF